MAGAEVKVAIVGDNSDLQRSLDQSQSSLRTFGVNVAKMAAAVGAAAAVGLGVLAKASVDAASQAQQSIGATETVFGKYADTVVRDSKRAADALGLSADEYRNNANILGSLLGNQGVASDKLAGKTKNLVKMGADLAATFGGTTTDAVNALASAFKGEFDPLEQYGVSIKQSAINTEAMRVAGVETTSAFNDLTTAQQNAAKQQATTNLLTKQAAKSQGAFAKETDTLAHQQQVLNAQWENLKAQLGSALLPAVTDFVKLLNNEAMPALSDLARQHLPAVRQAMRHLFDEDPGARLAAIGDAVEGIDWGTLASSAGDLADTLHELGPALADISVDTVNDSLSVFAELVGFAADHIETLRTVLPFLVAGYVALKGAQLLNNVAGRDSVVGMLAQWQMTRKLDSATKQLTIALREMQVAQTGATGALNTGAAATATATTKTSKLGIAAKGAAGAAGLGLLVGGAMTANESLGDLGTVAGSVATGFAVGGPWGAAIGGAVGLVQSLIGANDGLVDSMAALDEAAASNDIDQLTESIAAARVELDKATSATVYGTDKLGGFLGNVINTVAPLSNMTRFMGALTGDTEDTAAAIERAERQVAAMRDGSYAASFTLGGMAFALERNAEAAQAEADALTDATNAMRDQRAEAQRGLNAQLDYEAAVDAASEAVKQNGKTVDKGTEAGRNNLRTLYDIAGAWNDQSDAVKNAKGSLAGARKSFVDAATSMGMSEDAAKRLARQLLEIKPRDVHVGVTGVEAATTQVRTLKEVIAETKSKDIYINLHYQTIGNKPKAPTPGSQRTALRAAPSDEFFGTQGATKGLDAIAAGLTAIANLIDKTASKRIKDDAKADKAAQRINDKLRERYKLLRQNGKAQDDNATALDNARNAFAAYAEQVRQSFVDFGNIGNLGRLDNGRVSLPKLMRDLRNRARDAAEFSTLLQQLSASGLDKTQIEQLQSLGPEQALATARAIAQGGDTAIQEINQLSRDIAASGSGLGTVLADKYSIAGQTSAQAYIDTLVASQATLDKTATKMANALVKQLEAQLAQLGKGGDGQGGGKGGGKQGKQPDKDKGYDPQNKMTVTLTSQQVSQLERGRQIQLDLDAYRNAGGRARR